MAYKQTGRLPDKLANAPALPVGCGQLWADYLELHSARGASMAGPDRITFRDLLDWQEFRGVTLAAWEVDAIRAADAAFFAVRAER